jgi:ribosome-binding factor A
MKPFQRSDRVGHKIKQVLSELLLKEINDPRLEMVTITDVKMSADLRIARVYFVSSGGKNSRDEIARGFRSAMGYVKRKFARQVGLRYTPDLKFFYDNSFDYGDRIEAVLKKIKTQNESDHQPAENQ